MKRREFVKTSLCLGCAGAFTFKEAFSMPLRFTREEELAMQKFIYKSVEELPKKIRLDICNLCQLNCPACWMRIDEKKIMKRNGFGYVSFEQFKSFIDKTPHLEEIEISNNGEVFLNPDIDKIIEYAYKKNISIYIKNGTNLNTLSEETAENLVKYQVRYMNISIDGASPETYEIYRRGGNFNTVINNIKMINKYKQKYKSKYPYLVYKFILFGHNEHEIDDAKKLAKDLNMGIKFDVNYAKWYSPVKNKKEVIKKLGLAKYETNKEKHFQDFISGGTDWFFCTDLFNSPQINWNGDLLGCCMQYLDNFGVNVFEEGLLNALNSPNVLQAKLMLSDFSFKPKGKVLCNDCTIYESKK